MDLAVTIMNAHQSVVWIDHQEARILRVESEIVHVSTIHPRGPEQQPPGAQDPEDHADELALYFHEVARALDVADEILIVGPSAAKLEFVKYMNKNEHALDPRILGVETVEHPSDKRLIDFATLYFKGRGPSPRNGSS